MGQDIRPWQISVVVPCFNEEGTIRETARSILSYLHSHFPDKTNELVLVNDGSTDGTLNVLRSLELENPEVNVQSFPINRGRGAAIKTGIKRSRGTYVIVLDADLSYDVDHVGEIMDQFLGDSRVDVVVVSAYMKGGVVKGLPWRRLLVSRLANWILSGFFSNHLSTVTCVVRGYRGTMIRSLPLFEDGKELHLEILRKLSLYGARIVEIPGRLIWPKDRNAKKIRASRQKNMRFVRSATQHLSLGMLIKPARVFKYFASVLFIIGLYETFNVMRGFFRYYEPSDNFWLSVWKALAATFAHSPHTVVIACVSIILGFQAFSYVALLQILKLQQEETLRHLLAALGGSREADST